MAPSKPALDLNAMINAGQTSQDPLFSQTIIADAFQIARVGSTKRLQQRSLAEVADRAHQELQPRILARQAQLLPSPAESAEASQRYFEHHSSEGIDADNPQRTVSNSARPARASPKPNAGNVDAEWTHDLHALNNLAADKVAQIPPRGPRAGRGNRNDRLYSALNGSASSPALNNQFNIVGSAKTTGSISIRGLAGPYIVIAKNLALGTTAADIESAMTPVGGVVLGCRLIAERPKVIAELIFESKEGADNVVDTFNNQNVSQFGYLDGRDSNVRRIGRW